LNELEQRINGNLNSEDEQLRLQAFLEAREQNIDLRAELLRRGLGDASWRVRKEAILYFFSCKDPSQQLGEIISLLHDQENAGLRNAALEILIKLGSLATPELLEELKSSDQDVRKFVLDILGDIGDEKAVGAMIGCFADEDPNVRTAAVENLGKVGSSEAIPALLDAMQVPDFSWRFTILEALSRIGERVPVVKLLAFQEDALLRKPLFDCLGHIGSEEVVPVLIAGLGDAGKKARAAAACALTRIAGHNGEEVRHALVKLRDTQQVVQIAELLEGGERETQKAAVQLLGWIGDARIADRLLPLLGDDALCDNAGAALLACGPGAICDLVREHLGENEEQDLYLIELAGRAQCKELTEMLIPELGAPQSLRRQVTAAALGRLGEVESIDPLCAALNDEAEGVRDAAAEALCILGGVCPGEVTANISQLAAGPDGAVRAECIRILGQIGGPETARYILGALKDESAAVRQAAVRGLEARGDENLRALQLALTDEDSGVRALAAEALGASGDPMCVAPLALALNDEDIWVRSAAVRALGNFPSERAMAFVKSALHDPVELVVIAGLETLAKRHPQAARHELLQALVHSDEEVVKTALRGLSGLSDRSWLFSHCDSLLDHDHWDVRLAFVTSFQPQEAALCRERLEERLLVEEDDMVREKITELLSTVSEDRKQV